MRLRKLALAAAAVVALLASREDARAALRPPVRVALVLTRHPPALQPFLDAFEAAALRDNAATVRVHSFEGRTDRIDGVLREIGASQPDVIVGVFEQACSILVQRRGVLPPVPLLHALTLEPPVSPVPGGTGSAPLPGLSATLPIERTVQELRRFLPALRTVGIVCATASQSRVDEGVARLREQRSPVTLRVRTIDGVAQASAALREVAEAGLDCYLVVSDRLSAQDGFVELAARAARERRVPLVVPSRAWLAKGALVAFDAELPELGAQAAALAIEAARGGADFATATPAEIAITVHRGLLDRFPEFHVPEGTAVRWAEDH